MNLPETLNKLAAVDYKEHQRRAAEALGGTHGLVVNHGLGSGKGLSSILAGDAYGGANVIVPASLQENYKKELRKAHPKNWFNVQSYEGFVSHPPKDIDKKMLIVDEAHRLRGPGARAHVISDAASKAKKVMLLTGTPVQNKPHELASLVNIAAGKNVLPTGDAFEKRFLGEKTEYPGFLNSLFRYDPHFSPTISHRGELEKALRGRISFYKPSAAAKRESGYPTVTHVDIPTTMSSRQSHYHAMLYKSLSPVLRHKIEHGLPAENKDIKAMDAFLSAGRQISNTTEAFDKEFHSDDAVKINEIARRIKHGHGQSLAYSNYLKSGIAPLSKRLTELGVPHKAFTGEVSPSERNSAVSDYNSGKIKALLLSSAGGEGLDLKGTRAIHIVEPHFNSKKIDQVVGRGARFGSHSGLPMGERDVKVYHYIAKMPQRLFGPRGKTADEYLTEMSRNKERVNKLFLGVAQRASVEQSA